MPLRTDGSRSEDDPFWYKDAIIYEVHVRGFSDGNADGVGDFQGLTEKLDYLQDLGITAIWLLPFYPSPLKDDGYDIADYTGVNPAYGTPRDVKRLVREAHRRGLRVITELVCNHTSDQHPWFRRAREARPGSPSRDYYVWSDTPDRYQDARIIFKDFERSNWSWDPVAGAYYWHRFYSHQPDLNYDNPRVRGAILSAMDYWLRIGIDGLRLDAVPYLYEREGTDCENLPETHSFLKALRNHVDERFANRMLLAEANQWPEDAAAYFGEGDQCHMAFHFPLMPRLFMAIRMEDRFPIVDILRQTPRIPESCQWALFLRNHDELTLEMVTDEERDYAYREYARAPEARINLGIRRRLAPLLGNHRRRIELMNGLLFSLPGTPVIYYGDEIGMGDNIHLGDRNGVRTPMQWSSDRNAGFSKANPQRLYLPVIVDPEYHFETVNVETQQSNPHSLLWWTKRLIALRKRYKAFGRGSLEFLNPENGKVLAFLRRYEKDTVLVVANLSRFVQCAELDLPEFRGLVPVEMFGGTEFPPVGERPYFLSLGPHTFYWFSLQPARAAAGYLDPRQPKADACTLTVTNSWESLFEHGGNPALAQQLLVYLRGCPWFDGRARQTMATQILDAVSMPFGGSLARLVLMRVDYVEGAPETYLLPLAYVSGERATRLVEESPHSVVTRLRVRDGGTEGVVFDALADRNFRQALLHAFADRRPIKSPEGELRRWPGAALGRKLGIGGESPEISTTKSDQSGTLVTYGDSLVVKLFRRVEAGVNPDLEIGRYLTNVGFARTPPTLAALEYRPRKGDPATLAILRAFASHQEDGWQYTLDVLSRYFEQALASNAQAREQLLAARPSMTARALLKLAEQGPSALAIETLGGYLDTADRLGREAAEMHRALATETVDSSFAPETFTMLYQRSVYQSMRSLTARTLQSLQKGLGGLPDRVQGDARRVLGMEAELDRRFQSLLRQKIVAMRIRCHGDFHLAKLLRTGNDFMITNFEGEPARPMSERRIKRSPFRDVASMLRSFHYASHVPLLAPADEVALRPEDRASLEPWALFWCQGVGAAFLRSYLAAAHDAPFLPRTREEVEILLDAFLLEKAVYELGHELSNRPGWVAIPLRGILRLMEVPA